MERNFGFAITSAEVSDGILQENKHRCAEENLLLYTRDDGQGDLKCPNTGFFVHFGQGFLDQGEFSIDLPTSSINL